jgi:hypothetical protein
MDIWSNHRHSCSHVQTPAGGGAALTPIKQGRIGDRLNVVLAAAGFNFHQLRRLTRTSFMVPRPEGRRWPKSYR